MKQKGSFLETILIKTKVNNKNKFKSLANCRAFSLLSNG